MMPQPDVRQYFSIIIKTILKRFMDSDSVEESTRSESEKLYYSYNRAFLSALSGKTSTLNESINQNMASPEDEYVLRFYQDGLKLIQEELDRNVKNDHDFAEMLQTTSNWFYENGEQAELSDLAEKSWMLFFPEAVGIISNEQKSVSDLIEKRTVHITQLNADPVRSPLEEIVFTSNALLTIPSKTKKIEDLEFSADIKTVLSGTANDEQRYWYDHPIQIGVESEKNEVLYGMRALNEAVAFEKKNRNAPESQNLTCILSASVTHDKLHQIVQQYLEDEFHRGEGMENLSIYLFTESETDSLVEEILVPAAVKYLNIEPALAKEQLQVFGVDGEYGRHYSFLKAIVAFWQVFIDPSIKATFKIDLDQVFSQEELVKETGLSAFEHLCTPLWGAQGMDSDNDPVDMGMIAGALVNEKDIHKSLFTADVPIPEKINHADELIFFSKLPQAISTQAEMQTRYESKALNGIHSCIQRVHVTGGTNGILIRSLFKYRPFTPSFFGRAEDQAYILSVLDRDEKNLAYVHKDGLIMRHDKEAFAQEAIKAAHVGKLVGDYTRILYFSAYSDHLAEENARIKRWLDPFTGCFISKIPVTVAYLRFALKADQFLQKENGEEALAFIKNGVKRIGDTLKFISDDLSSIYENERAGWELYYNILEACQNASNTNDDFINNLKARAQKLIKKNHLNI